MACSRTGKTVNSADGGAVSYYELGSGPGLIIVHGGMETWQSHRELGEALSSDFTVYLVDRRGRGKSCSAGPNYSIQTEVADIQILAEKTGARLIFGVSSGALVSMQASLCLEGVFQKAALYEPPVVVDKERHSRLFAQFQEELQGGDVEGALMTGMKMTEMGPRVFRAMPYWLGRPLLRWALAHEPQRTDGRPSVKDLVPTMECDFALVKEMQGRLGTFAGLKGTEVLLISGTASRPFLIRSVEETERIIPGAKLIRLKGLTHLGSGNKDTDGKPDLVAGVLKKFFSSADP